MDNLALALPAGSLSAWMAEIAVAKVGMHGKPMTQDQIDLAARDYLAQAKYDGAGKMIDANLSHFRGFLRRAAKPAIARPSLSLTPRPSKQAVGVMHLQNWLNEDTPNGG